MPYRVHLRPARFSGSTDRVQGVRPHDRGYGPIPRESNQAADADHPAGLQERDQGSVVQRCPCPRVL